MLRAILLCAAMLALFSPATACTCAPPPPLSDCEVDADEAALLVTIKCVTTKRCSTTIGTAVADVEIDRVFKDRTDLDLKKGDTVSIKSSLQSAACGQGGSFSVNDQWIMFVRTPFQPQPDAGRLLLSARPVKDISDVTLCDLESADFETSICSGNILDPTDVNVEALAEGCVGFTKPPIFTTSKVV